MKIRRLGQNGPDLPALGLGCMGMSPLRPQPGRHDAAKDAESVATIQAALDAGLRLINTGEFYGMGYNELLIRQALRGRREQAFLSVKFGMMVAPGGHPSPPSAATPASPPPILAATCPASACCGPSSSPSRIRPPWVRGPPYRPPPGPSRRALITDRRAFARPRDHPA